MARMPTLTTTGAGLLAGTALLALAAPLSARPEPLRFGPYDNMSLFSISKSENKNEVVYAIHLDAQCAPTGDAPVFAFWRMHEKGPSVVEPLLGREERAYGIDHQRVLARGDGRNLVEVTLRALTSRPILVELKPGAGRCDAWSTLAIAGESAYLYNVYVKLKMLGVESLLLSGWAMDRSRILHETIPASGLP
jgi:hypothetical protein